MDLPALTDPGAGFAWALGIEDTFIPQAATRTGRILDEYVLTQHDRFWRDDLRRIADTGTRHLRYGIPWYRVNPAPDRFDWSWTDEVLPYLVQDLGIAPILDLVHYGAPTWLNGTFLSPDYPERVAAYAVAVAERYGSLIRSWTPLNEPRVHAHYAGHLGIWPPYRRGTRGFATVLASLAEGIARTIDGIRAVRPDAVIVHVEALASVEATDPSMEPEAARRRGVPFLAADLAEGRIQPDEPRWAWFRDLGVDERRLERLAGSGARIDVWGGNFYPQASCWVLAPGGERGQARRRPGSGEDLERVLRELHARVDRPIMLTETSVRGHLGPRRRWLEDLEAVSGRLRADAVPLVGATWFPAFSLLSWDYRRGRRAVDAYLAHYGLWDLRPSADGTLQRVETPLVDLWRQLVRRG